MENPLLNLPKKNILYVKFRTNYRISQVLASYYAKLFTKKAHLEKNHKIPLKISCRTVFGHDEKHGF